MSTLPLFGNGASGNGTGGRSRPKSGGGAGGSGPRKRVYRVSQVNRAARMMLEDRFNQIWIEGELSDVTRAASGHVYFTLNDEEENAQLRGVMFRSDAARARTRLENGARVQLRGTVSLFEPRGSYQLIARVAMPQGQGDLQARFEEIRRKLEAEGLFDPERKRPLPKVPRVVGLVTSEHGAALHDIIRVSQARCPTRLLLSPCVVQGRDAPKSIVQALQRLGDFPELSVVIIGRGGGSAEDLFAFNDERVARAIAACPVPVVSAVGHEVDVTIADLVADVRASTPSNAAELVVPDRESLLAELEHRTRGLHRAMRMRLDRARLTLDRLARDLEDPRAVLVAKRRRLERLERSLTELMRAELAARRRALAGFEQRLSRLDPRVLLTRKRARLERLQARMRAALARQLGDRKAHFAQLVARLSAMSPLVVLGRGYAIALHGPSGKALLRAEDARPGDDVTIRLHQGSLATRVEQVLPEANNDTPPSNG